MARIQIHWKTQAMASGEKINELVLWPVTCSAWPSYKDFLSIFAVKTFMGLYGSYNKVNFVDTNSKLNCCYIIELNFLSWQSPRREVPDHIQKPDYAETGLLMASFKSNSMCKNLIRNNLMVAL